MCGISALEEEAEALDDRKRVLEGSILELKHELRLVMASRERVRSKLDDLTALQAREVIQSDDRFACELDAVARKYFGVVSFRENQKEACTAILNGFDVSLVMPTGGGKTLCVVLPTIILGKLTVVVSPLVSLMVDQVSMLKAHGLAAEYLSGQCSRQRQTSVRQQLKAAVGNPELQLLFVTPERVAKSKLLLSVLEKIHDAGHLGLLAVDEAHCVSKWGHSFRPDYARLTLLKKHFRCPILAMTATATPAVLKDLQTVLGIQKSLVFKSHVVRHNLHYRVVWRPKTLQGSVEWLATFIKGRPGHSGVVYCITRKDSETVADLLNSSGVASGYYHGDLDGMFFHCVYFLIFHVPTSITASSRNSIYEQWSDHRLQVVVATTAFGMGIHKGDVRFVIHMGLPKSISNFYQESGRAGRDGLPADCVVMYRPGDVSRHSCMVYWEKSGLDELYQCARFCTTDKCRRVLVSKYFGDPEPTCSVCDNCRNPREPQECLLTTEDLESLEALLKRDAEQDTRVGWKGLTYRARRSNWPPIGSGP
ncbi:MAG: hypothetical protein KVP17_001969 [Porospora cf. gigantea B]|uniref:uncharacterized protein n=1 Tax=Porospora cf. gigantea B TaxID=2853592 RepID=UPI003571DCED|nr:MAG: hypothetical protein KVP17_001969 [Porospora cf. gigantea B]